MDDEFRISRNHYIVLLIIFTEVLGFSLALPVIPFLALDLGLNPFEIGLIISIFSFAQFFSAPIIGKLSDQFGRKRMLIISQTSTTVGFILLGFTNTVWMLILARLVDGLFGSNMTLAQTVLSDITPNHARTRVYGYSSAVFGAGLIFGPAVGGYLAGFSFGLPMFLAAGISFVSILLVLYLLPETRQDFQRSFSFSLSNIIPIRETRSFMTIKLIRVALIMLFLYNLAFNIFISNVALFFEIIINATPQDIGLLMAWIGILRVLLQSGLIEPLINRIGENVTLITGIVAMLLSMLLMGITTSFFIAFIPMTFLAYGTGVSRPILTSKLTNTVDQSQTGTLLGVNNSLVSSIQITAPTMGGLLLTYVNAPSLALASSLVYLLLLAFWYLNQQSVRNPGSQASKI